MSTERESQPVVPPRVGLVLPGGGARAAYQVGVLRAIADLLPARSANPFPVVTGTSAGAVNATAIAVHADRFRVAIGNLERVWRNFQVGQVFRADSGTVIRSGLHWALAMMSGGWLLPPPRSLFDNSPLRELLRGQFDFAGIRRSIDAGHLDAIAMSAAGYTTGRSVSFYDSKPGCDPWSRTRRTGEPTDLSLDHVMASVAVPFLFPPVSLGDEYYGDGAMREANPFSAAIHLGAQRLLVIGTRNENRPQPPLPPVCPTFGQIFGYMLDALFSDGLYADLERLTQINQIVDRVGALQGVGENNVHLRRIDIMVIMPSRDLSEIARHHTALAAAGAAHFAAHDGRAERRRRPVDELPDVPGQLHARADRARLSGCNEALGRPAVVPRRLHGGQDRRDADHASLPPTSGTARRDRVARRSRRCR